MRVKGSVLLVRRTSPKQGFVSIGNNRIWAINNFGICIPVIAGAKHASGALYDLSASLDTEVPEGCITDYYITPSGATIHGDSQIAFVYQISNIPEHVSIISGYCGPGPRTSPCLNGCHTVTRVSFKMSFGGH